MNTAIQNELNKKLAEGVGFSQGMHTMTKYRHGYLIWRAGEKFWRYPNHTGQVGLPLFTESLDLCFKWLVPNTGASVVGWNSEKNMGWARVFSKDYKAHYYEIDKTPALALCKAIEKLIDEEKQ